ncbi:MAG: hypothetical protein II965_07995 [Pyramidobacter sp.]|nr:hypothetical protein [Pyramidobacter sp.]
MTQFSSSASVTHAAKDFGHIAIGEFELATAMLFDLGVACVVVGAVLMALAQLAHIAQRAAKYEGEGRA